MTPNALARHLSLPAKDVVAELTNILGPKLVAVLGGANSTPTVRRWMAGEEACGKEDRLRTALEVVDILLTREQADVVRAWFVDQEPHLDDRSPLLVLAESDGTLARQSVIAAARAFIS
jgi:hypothetical protein